MMTRHSLTRVRRQMQQRIRLTLVQRRVDAQLAATPPPETPAESPPAADSARESSAPTAEERPHAA